MTFKQTRKRRAALRRNLCGAAIAAPFVIGGAHVPSAAAATFEVRNGADADKGSLRRAIEKANAHVGRDRIEFARGIGRIEVRRALTVKGPTTIDGPGAGRLAVQGRDSGTDLRFVTSGRSSVHGLTLDRISVRGKSLGGNTDLRLTESRLSGHGIDAPGVRMEGPTDLRAELNVSRTRIAGFEVGIDTVYMGGRIDRVLITRNEPGGGISIGEGGFEITKSTISGNTGTEGGGISSGYYANALVTNSTISGNTATVSGGGLFGYVNVRGSTVTDNSAPKGGGFHPYGGVDSASFEGSIVAGNSAPAGADCFGNPVIVDSKGGNVFGLDGCGAPSGEDVLAADPGLRPLDDNGGPTPTHALRQGSPAIDNAPDLDLPVDQRGRKRDGQPDSGSFERR